MDEAGVAIIEMMLESRGLKATFEQVMNVVKKVKEPQEGRDKGEY